MLGFLLLVITLLRTTVRDRGDLVAENLLLRQQLDVLTRPTGPRRRLRTRDKLVWMLARAIWGDWRRHLFLVRPETVVGWYRRGWRLVWPRRSRGRPGRPRLAAEARALIARMARENPAWGSERIRGELLNLGIAVSRRSVQRYRQRGPARPPSQTWRTVLANHAGQLRAADLSTGADADLSAALDGAVQPPGKAPSPASVRVGDPERRGPAATARGSATSPATAHRDWPTRPHLEQGAQRLDGVGGPHGAAVAGTGTRRERQPVPSERAPAVSGPGSPEPRPPAAAPLRAPRARRVLRLRAPPPHAPPGTPQVAGRPAAGPLRVWPVVGGLHHAYERAASLPAGFRTPTTAAKRAAAS